ncbi:MAG: Protein kinase [Myxococcales bacterium]|nr:Protein kinase [Myxococcales bacterium]
MGEVYVGTQQIVQTRVAIKVLREDISNDRKHVQRFFNEAITASKIKHAGIVNIFDVGFHGERAFLIMEHLEGESLASRIKRPPRIALGEIIDTSAQLASILEATHAAGITHRDLKPDNIFVTTDAELASKRRIKVLDFGIAKLSATAAAGPEATAMTLTNSSMGTPAYMAPEQWVDAASADARADIYALGCVIFELCCGRPPFVASTHAEACAKHLHEVAPRVHDLVAELPASIDALVVRTLAKKPDERPPIREVVAVVAALRVQHAPAGKGAAAAEGELGSAATVAPSGAPQGGVDARSTPPASSAVANAVTAKGGPDSRPVGVAVVDEGSAAAAVTVRGGDADGAPSRAPAMFSRSMTIAGLGALALAGAVVFTTLRSHERPAPPTPPTKPVTTTTATAGSTGTAVVPVTAIDATAAIAPPPGCPDGMVRVPASELAMGTDNGMDWEKPVHSVTISAPYCIDRTEVTVGAYAACVAQGACRPAPTAVNIETMDAEKHQKYSMFCTGSREDRLDHPINCVAWEHANAYCTFASKRLPTEAEWELAARGTDGRRYPWGNEPPNATKLNLCGAECRAYAKRIHGFNWYVAYEDDDGWGGTAPVGSFPGGASPFGALDMAGNVAEWTADWYEPYDETPVTDPRGPRAGIHRAVRDTSWRDAKIDFARSTHRIRPPPTRIDDQIGFRCARATDP